MRVGLAQLLAGRLDHGADLGPFGFKQRDMAGLAHHAALVAGSLAAPVLGVDQLEAGGTFQHQGMSGAADIELRILGLDELRV